MKPSPTPLPLFRGKRIADCEILSFDRDTGVGLANLRGWLVRFEGHPVEQDSQNLKYAAVRMKILSGNLLEIEEIPQ